MGSVTGFLRRGKELRGRKRGVLVLAAIILIAGYGCGNSFEGKIVAVELQGSGSGTLEGARLVLMEQESTGDEPRILTGEFASAAAPSLSHDGRFLYFQGKKDPQEPWQIWVLDLKKNAFSQVTRLEEDCTDPVPLPDGTVIFGRENKVGDTPVRDLWRCGTDGCCLTRITHHPALNQYPVILLEGRILYLSSQQVPEAAEPALMVMLPDGSKSELYSEGCSGRHPVSGGAESAGGYVYFITDGGKLARLQHRRPLHTSEIISGLLPGAFGSVYSLPDGRCLVSYRPGQEAPFGIYTFDPGGGDNHGALHAVFAPDGPENYTDPLLIAAMEVRPRKLPSAVNPDNQTGLLMSQDINHSMLPAHESLNGDTVAVSVRISYLGGGHAEVKAESDGSFYVKLDADMPFRIETLNSQGESVRGPSDWLYLRPNERRACTGCHADPELAPENIQPMAVKKDPVEFLTSTKQPG